MLSPFTLGLAGTAVFFAAVLHGLFRLAEFLERRQAIFSRDVLVAPGILGLAVLIALTVEPIGARLGIYPGNLVVAALIGMKIGTMVPRPPRRRASRISR